MQLKTIRSKTLKIHPMFLSCSSSIGISIIYFGHNHRYKTLTEFKSSLITSNFTHSINHHSHYKKEIIYLGIFGSDRSSRSHNLRPEITTFSVQKSPPSSVRPFLICHELSIFILMGQIFFRSTQRALKEHSKCTQMALIEHK